MGTVSYGNKLDEESLYWGAYMTINRRQRVVMLHDEYAAFDLFGFG